MRLLLAGILGGIVMFIIWDCDDPRVKLELLSRIYADEFARVEAFGSPYHKRPNGRVSEIKSAPRPSLRGRIS